MSISSFQTRTRVFSCRFTLKSRKSYCRNLSVWTYAYSCTLIFDTLGYIFWNLRYALIRYIIYTLPYSVPIHSSNHRPVGLMGRITSLQTHQPQLSIILDSVQRLQYWGCARA